jgi:hypothetical protein
MNIELRGISHPVQTIGAIRHISNGGAAMDALARIARSLRSPDPTQNAKRDPTRGSLRFWLRG